jgi:hypothetical protein
VKDNFFDCGLPTKAGPPCKQRALYYWDAAGNSGCRKHLSAEQLADAERKNEIYRAGVDVTRARYEQYAEKETRDLHQEIAKLRKEAAKVEAIKHIATFRDEDHAGRQLVTVNSRYSYAWDGAKPLVVGDKVKLPSTGYTSGGWVGSVTGLGTNYDGHCELIVSKWDAATA